MKEFLMLRKLLLVSLICFPLLSQADIDQDISAEEFISALEMTDAEAESFNEEISKMSANDRRELTVCGSIGGGVILSVDIFRCHDVNNNDYLMTFKGFGLSFYAKAGIVYIHSKRPILPGFYRAHEAGIHTGVGGYAIKFKNKQTKFTIRGLTYGIGLELAFGKAEVKVLNH